MSNLPVTPDDVARLNAAIAALGRDKGSADAIAADLARRYPDEPRVHVAYAASRSLLQDYETAARHLDLAACFADSASIRFNLGYCHRQLGDYERAAAHFRRGLVLPGAGESLRVLAANTYDVVARREDALRCMGGAGVAEAPDATPISVFCRWLLARSAAGDSGTAPIRAYFAGYPERIDAAVLFWMKYDCHLFAELDDKARLARLLERAVAAGAREIEEFWPETLTVAPGAAPAPARDARPGWWLFKPSGLSGGQGMALTRDPAALRPAVAGIVQRYLHPPFLVMGRKFNLRLLLGVLSVTPLRLFLWRDGLVFLSPEPYAEPGEADAESVGIAHAVNLLRARPEAIGRPLGLLPAHIVGLRTFLSSGALGADEAARMEDGILRLAAALKGALEASGFVAALRAAGDPAAFPPRFVGLDVGFDPDLRPWLFEIERYPGIGGVSPQSAEINGRFRRDWLSFVLAEEPEAHPAFRAV